MRELWKNSRGSAIVCSRCGQEIGLKAPYWYINGEKLCENCLPEFAKEVFAPFCLIRGGRRL